MSNAWVEHVGQRNAASAKKYFLKFGTENTTVGHFQCGHVTRSS